MISEGDDAPDFSLPAVVDGDFEEVSLADYLGDDIIILAFYPADFNPSCAGETTDLDELDLFTMQKDVSILGISGDSVYSHRAFADEYDLHIPLLADVHGEVSTDYGVAVEDDDAGYLTNRAVVVIDPGGEVQYAWQTENLKRLPPVEAVREAVEDVGGSSTAEARYRVGHAHYVEGRRAFTKAMSGFEQMEWMMAQGDFTRAQNEFEEAADQFNTAVRFAEDETPQEYFERAEEKARALWQAAEWLAQSASAYASGEGAEGDEMRDDAESPLETARDIHEPPNPDDFPPEEDPAAVDTEEEPSILPDEDEGPPAALESDLAGDPETPEAEALADEMTAADDPEPATADPTAANEVADDASPAASETADEDSEDEIDDEELEEIAAELEEQTKQAKAKHEQENAEDQDQSRIVDDPPLDDADTDEPDPSEPDAEDVEGDVDEDIELDLADPTEGTEMEPDEPADIDDDTDDEDEDDDLSSGSHGVPDSL